MRNDEMPLPPPPQLLAQEPPAATMPVATGSAVGKELPDEPGRWTREDGDWEIEVRDELMEPGPWERHAWNVKTGRQVELSMLPRGNWFPALPESREVAELRGKLEAAEQRISLAGGYHQRTPREVAIDDWLCHKPSHIPGPTQSDISYLLKLVDAGRNRVHEEIEKREAAERRLTELEAARPKSDDAVNYGLPKERR